MNLEENYELIHATKYLQDNEIPCIKYNYSLDKIVQNFTSYKSFLTLSEDGNELIITTMKPIEKQPRDDDDEASDQEENLYTYTKSSCSTDVENIQGIIFGGISSRFWLLRKHINSIESVSDLQQLPFFSWDCITL